MEPRECGLVCVWLCIRDSVRKKPTLAITKDATAMASTMNTLVIPYIIADFVKTVAGRLDVLLRHYQTGSLSPSAGSHASS